MLMFFFIVHMRIAWTNCPHIYITLSSWVTLSIIRPVNFQQGCPVIAQQPTRWRINPPGGCFKRPLGSVFSVNTGAGKPAGHRHPLPSSPTEVCLRYIVVPHSPPLLNLPDCRCLAAVDAAVLSRSCTRTADSMRKKCSHSFWSLGRSGLY